MKNRYSVVSLFAGAGGLDFGFKNQGFKTVWANDIDKDACQTYRSWSDAEVVCGDISKINISDIPDSDIIIGGFPCQGFSLAGPRKIDDRRNQLYRYFVNLVEKKQPSCFVAENVKGILTLDNGRIIQAIIEDFALKGYNVFPKLINAADYDVPQDRWRVILVGFRKDLNISQYNIPTKGTKVFLKDVLQQITAPAKNDICQAPFSSRFMSRNRKRSWCQVSYTIPAMSKQVPLHPSSPDMIKLGDDSWCFGKGVTRRLSWQESAIVQTFPPDLEFSGNLVSKYKQIGNAVPVKLAEAIAKTVFDTLSGSR